jgi:hypothetical protein
MGCDGESPSSRRHSRRTEALPSLLSTGMVQLTTAASNRPAVGFSAASSAHRQRNLSLCTRQCDSEAPHDGSGPLRRAPAPVPVCARAEKPGARLVSGAASVEVSECALMLRLGRATGYGAPKCHSREMAELAFLHHDRHRNPCQMGHPLSGGVRCLLAEQTEAHISSRQALTRRIPQKSAVNSPKLHHPPRART